MFSVIQTHHSCDFHLAVDFLGLRRGWSWSQIIDQPQDVSKQGSRHRHLVQLERDMAAVADNFGADLDQLLAHRGRRPTLDTLGPRQLPLVMLWTAPTTGIAVRQMEGALVKR
jgi:hypothetical protein